MKTRNDIKQAIGYVIIFIISLASALTVAFTWKKWLYEYILTIDPIKSSDDNIIAIGFTAIFAIGYNIFAERVVETVWNQYEEIRYLHITDDKKNFLAKKDLRIKGIIHFCFAVLAIFILVIIMIMRYDSMRFGQLMIGLWVFTVTMWLLLAIELDNPFSGFWTIEMTDPWYIRMSRVKINTHEELYKHLKEAEAPIIEKKKLRHCEGK